MAIKVQKETRVKQTYFAAYYSFEGRLGRSLYLLWDRTRKQNISKSKYDKTQVKKKKPWKIHRKFCKNPIPVLKL